MNIFRASHLSVFFITFAALFFSASSGPAHAQTSCDPKLSDDRPLLFWLFDAGSSPPTCSRSTTVPIYSDGFVIETQRNFVRIHSVKGNVVETPSIAYRTFQTCSVTSDGPASLGGDTNNVCASDGTDASGINNGDPEQTITQTFTNYGGTTYKIVNEHEGINSNIYKIYSMTVSGGVFSSSVKPIKLERSGSAIGNGATDSLTGTIYAGVESEVEYTIVNDGSEKLTVTGISIDGTPGNVTGTPTIDGGTGEIAGGSSSPFKVKYTPTVAGDFSFNLEQPHLSGPD